MEQAVDETSEGYIPPEERLVVSDMDGTLITKNSGDLREPDFAELELVKLMVKAERTSDDIDNITSRQIVNNYENYITDIAADGTSLSGAALAEQIRWYKKVISYSLSGLTMEESVNALLKHVNKPYALGNTFEESFYEPMLDLYRYLRENDFHFYIVSGSNRNTIYAMVRDVFVRESEPFPYDHCLGLDLELVPEMESENRFQLVQSTEEYYDNLNINKSVLIARQLGKTPVLALGNSSGDTEMLNWTLSNADNPSLGVIIVHDDAEREQSYNVEKMNSLCQNNEWLCVSMKEDFSVIYE